MNRMEVAGRVPVDAAKGLIEDALAAAGLPRPDAAKCAMLMAEADLTGADAHGVFRLPQYVRRLKAGGFNPQPNITVTKSAPATALVDGDNGMGHLVMGRAAETAIALAKETGVSWAGEDITDAKKSAEGLLLPIGGYKGSGLAIMLGLLTGPLNRAAFGRDVVDFNADDASETNTGHFIIALDIARFLPLADYKAEVDRHIGELKASKMLPGVDEIRMPGERRRACREERMRDGVPL